MAKNFRKYDEQFKVYAVQYVKNNSDLTLAECAQKLTIPHGTLAYWVAQDRQIEKAVLEMRRENQNNITHKTEIDELNRKLTDTQEAIEILKKAIVILGKDLDLEKAQDEKIYHLNKTIRKRAI